MAGHYSMIGFPLELGDDYWPLRAAREGDRMDVGGGSYRVLRTGSGAELWTSVTRRGKVGFAPHFAGGARCPLLLAGRLRRKRESRFEGSFEAVGATGSPAEPGDPERFGSERDKVAREHLLRELSAVRGRPRPRGPAWLGRGRKRSLLGELLGSRGGQMGAMEVVFDAPDARLHEDLALPSVADVQLAAFAQDCSWYASEADFFAWLDGEDMDPFRGLFAMHRNFDSSDEALAVASISGTVLETATRVNALTGLSFRWTRVGTSPGELDVVADAGGEGGEPVVGGVIYGRVYLSGRIVGVHSPGGA